MDTTHQAIYTRRTEYTSTVTYTWVALESLIEIRHAIQFALDRPPTDVRRVRLESILDAQVDVCERECLSELRQYGQSDRLRDARYALYVAVNAPLADVSWDLPLLPASEAGQ